MPDIRITRENITKEIENKYNISGVTVNFSSDGTAFFEKLDTLDGITLVSKDIIGASKLTDFTVDTWLAAFDYFTEVKFN